VGVVLGVAVAPLAAQAGPVDDATVRVFAIGTVGVEPLDVRGTWLQIASPVASHGTGFFLDGRLVMTAQHVIDGARHVVVRLPGEGGFLPARVVFADKDADTAVLEVEPTTPPAPLTLAAAAPAVRHAVFAVGYPIDATRHQPQSARGIIAGFLDNGTIQLDIALNPGNSGGPVVDDQDVVVGMATARGNVERGIQGIGYAVPVGRLTAALDAARRALPPAAAPTTTRDVASVVDELIQHGAL
jgi:serine protease Do